MAFIWKALWKKFAVRTRLSTMMATEVNCPFDSSIESIYHFTKACTYLRPLFLIIRSLLGVVYSKSEVIEPSRLIADHPTADTDMGGGTGALERKMWLAFSGKTRHTK